MDQKEFSVTCENTFAGITEQYGFSVTEQYSKQFRWEWILKNSTTGIRVVYEVRELYVWVLICRLVNGEIKRTTGEMRSDTTIHCFDFKGLLTLRKKKDDYPFYHVFNVANHNLSEILEHYVQDLEKYGADVLQGDFDVFRSLDVIVKNRAREFAYKKWGDRAREYGW